MFSVRILFMPKSYFANKKCFITGAASGIGKAVAIQLATNGAQLFLTDINEQQLADVVTLIRQKNGNVQQYKALDIANYEQVKAFADEIHQQNGAVDIVMNIAGIAIWGAVDKMQHEEWKKVIDINLMGPIHVIESFIPKMIADKKPGHLVNVASAAALFGLPWHGAYSASKYGLRGLSDVLRHDLKRNKIQVHLVCPGAVDTGLVQTLKISGLEIGKDEMQTLKSRFQQHAVSPDKAAQAMIDGIERNEYLIFTSPDIRFGFFGQQKFTIIYDWVMQKMNDYFQKTLQKK